MTIKRVIIGVDPGTQITGYGLIRVEGSRFVPLDFGCIKPPASAHLPERYRIIHLGIVDLMERYSPGALSVETQYIKNNPQSALKLGMARGVIILAASLKGIEVHEYTPAKAKRSVVGKGAASKEQVVSMIGHLLNLQSAKIPFDAADALALAICHAQALNFKERLAQLN